MNGMKRSKYMSRMKESEYMNETKESKYTNKTKESKYMDETKESYYRYETKESYYMMECKSSMRLTRDVKASFIEKGAMRFKGTWIGYQDIIMLSKEGDSDQGHSNFLYTYCTHIDKPRK